MTDDHHDLQGASANDIAHGGSNHATFRRDRTRRHLVVLVLAVVGIAIGGALVIGGRPSSTGTPSKRATHGTSATGTLLPSLGVVPDLAAAKALLNRLDPRSLRPDPNATTTSRPGSTAPSSSSTSSGVDPSAAPAGPGPEATQAGIRRCQQPIEQQTTDRSLGSRLAAARLQVGVATDLVVSYSLPASGNDPAATRVLLVGARSCRVLAAVQH